MRDLLALAAGLAAGAATMYYLDPHGGRRRRAVARDKLVAWSHDAGELAQRSGRRAANRVRGMAAAQRARRHESPPENDEQLRERVRAKLGHAIHYPGAIDVQASDGTITLSGPVLADDVPSLLRTMRDVSGVTEIDNRLSVHDEPGNVPELQGARDRRARAPSLLNAALAVVAIAAPTALVLSSTGVDAWRSRKGS